MDGMPVKKMLAGKGLLPKRVSEIYYGMKLRTKLIISYLILIIIPSFAIGFAYYSISSGNIVDITKANLLDIVSKNNEIMDQKLSSIVDSARVMNVDEDLFNFYNNVDRYSDYEIIQADKKISQILIRYFPQTEDVLSANIVTSRYTYGNSVMIVPSGAFFNSELYAAAKAAKGTMKWIPTYRFTDMLKLEELSGLDLDYSCIFSAVELLNPTWLDDNGNIIESTGQNVEKPVVIISFKPDLFEQVFQQSLSIPEASFCISTLDGSIISHSDPSRLAKTEDLPWLGNARKLGRGTMLAEIGGRKCVVSYETAKITGWVSAIIVPVDRLLSQVSNIRFYTLLLGILLILTAVLLAYLISTTITKPITKLIGAIKRIGEGKFDTKIRIPNNDEVGYLAQKFNEMDDKVQTLIEENYKSKLREKESEIMALNLQLNPHFLYNTLNVINMTALENDQKEISKMLVCISSMLQYTTKNRQEMVRFQEDLEWLRNYIYIMSIRFEGKFAVQYDIDPDLYGYNVPKLFLQPFIENAVIHGFEFMDDGGEIRLRGWLEDGLRYFSVRDNGIGMEEDRIAEVLDADTDSIGIANVNRRIRLIYGEAYGVRVKSAEGKGTEVLITLPQESKESATL